ncbi:DUF2878 domain-containing protein [Planctomycetota bacterium]
MMHKSWLLFIINIISFEIGWFASILGAAHGYFWLGPVVIVGLMILHFCLHKNWTAEIRLFSLCIFIGFGFDSLFIWLGIYEPKRGWLPYPLTTAWLVAMWVNFAMTLNVSLRRLQHLLSGAVVLGGIAGPLAYYGGHKLQAMQITEPLLKNLLLTGLGWAIVTPVLFYLARILCDKSAQTDIKTSQT